MEWTPQNDPTWTDVVGALSSIGTLIVVVVGAIFANRQLQETKRGRVANLLAELARRWDDMIEVRQAVASYADPTDLANAIERFYNQNSTEFYTFSRLPNFFEDLAVLVNEQSIPLEMVRASFGDAVVYHWSRWAAATAFLRRDQPTAYANFEELARRLEAITP